MENCELLKKLKEIAESEEVNQKLENVTSMEDAQKVFRDCGLEITAEDLARLLPHSQPSNSEIPLEELDAISGGWNFWKWLYNICFNRAVDTIEYCSGK